MGVGVAMLLFFAAVVITCVAGFKIGSKSDRSDKHQHQKQAACGEQSRAGHRPGNGPGSNHRIEQAELNESGESNVVGQQLPDEPGGAVESDVPEVCGDDQHRDYLRKDGGGFMGHS